MFHLQDPDVVSLISSTLELAGPLSGFCEEPGLIFTLHAKADLRQGSPQATTTNPVAISERLEDVVPDDGIQRNQLAIATELLRRLLLIYYGERPLTEISLAACAVLDATGCRFAQQAA